MSLSRGAWWQNPALALCLLRPQVTLEEEILELLEWVREQQAMDQMVQAPAELENDHLVR